SQWRSTSKLLSSRRWWLIPDYLTRPRGLERAARSPPGAARRVLPENAISPFPIKPLNWGSRRYQGKIFGTEDSDEITVGRQARIQPQKTRRCAVCDFRRREGCQCTGQQNLPRHTGL